MKSLMNERKYDHLRILAEDAACERNRSYFDEIHLKHQAMPGLDMNEIDTSVEFMGKKLSFPLLISCMTGGAGDELTHINRNLAIAAESTGVAMGMGSQRLMLVDSSAVPSFLLRKYAPDVLLFGNLGAVQLNYGVTADDCLKLVETTGIDALCLHLNPLQEAIQPEGDTNFSGLVAKIGEVVEFLDIPVVVKEVGAGIGGEAAEKLISAGVKYIDVAGSGGTSWSRIESHRNRSDRLTGVLFQDWGVPTPQALRECEPYINQATFIGSGGIRSGIDMVKAMILGASLCGIARPFIDRAKESQESVIQYIEALRVQFKTTMFLLGASKVEDLRRNLNSQI